jgi:hypothetical protein
MKIKARSNNERIIMPSNAATTGGAVRCNSVLGSAVDEMGLAQKVFWVRLCRTLAVKPTAYRYSKLNIRLCLYCSIFEA